MAEPRTTLDFTLTYDPATTSRLDDAYAQTEREARWRRALEDPEINPAAAPQEAPAGPETAPEVPGRQPTGDKPSPLTVAVQEAGKAAGEAAKAAMQGLTKALLPGVAPGGVAERERARGKEAGAGPVSQMAGEVAGGLVDKVAGVRQIMMEGLMGLGMAPFVGAGAGVRQALENAGIADTLAADPMQASFIRMLTSGVNPLQPAKTPEEQAQRQALWAPMTLGEFAEIAVQNAPLAAGAARKVAQAAKIQAPEIMGQRGALGPAERPALPEPGAPRGVGELNVHRVTAPDAVKGIMLELNALVGASERMGAHRERVSHEATIAAGKARGIDLQKLLNTDLESYVPDAPGQDALRNMYNAVGHVLDAQERRIALGDETALQQYIPTRAISLVLAALDEAGARNIARALEARKIGSEPGRASMKDMAALARRLGASSENLATTVGQQVAARARAAGERVAKAGVDPAATFSWADLIANKIGGELTLTTVAAELIRTAHGGRDPVRISAAEVIAAKMTAELQAAQPQIGAEALMATYRAFQRAQQLEGDAQVRAYDQAAVTIANYLAASGAVVPPTAMSLAEAVARKMAFEMMAQPQAAGMHPAALLAAMRQQMETERQMRTWDGNWWSGLQAGASIGYSAWVQGLISGLKTSARNILGMAISLPVEAPIHFTAEWVNRFVTRDPDGVQRGETAYALSHTMEAFRDAFRLTGEAWRQNAAPFEAAARKRQKVHIIVTGEHDRRREMNSGQATRLDNSAARWGFDPSLTLGKTIDVLNNAINSRYMPGGWLIAEDAFGQGLVRSYEIAASAWRTAVREGLEPGSAEFVKRVADLERAPLEPMEIAAQDKAILLTMNREFGPTGQLLMRGIDRIPGARILMPFVRWWTNAAKWTMQHVGGLNLLAAQNWRDLNPTGGNWGAAGAEAVARDRAIARVVVGTAATGAIVAAVLNGSITPSGSRTREDRAMRPFREEGSDSALKIGGAYVSGYHQWGGQAGIAVAAIAEYVDLLRHIPNQKLLDEWLAGLEGIAMASGYTFINQGAAAGLSDMFDAIQDPDTAAGKQFRRMAGSLVPTLVSDVARLIDDQVVHAISGATDAMRARLPYFNQGVPVHRHQVTGEVRTYPAAVAPDFLWPVGAFANMVTPIGVFTTQAERPWAKEIVAHRVFLKPIGDYISRGGFTTSAPRTGEGAGPQLTEPREVGSVELSDAEKDAAIVYMTQTAKDSYGRTLPEALDALVRSPEYQVQSTGPLGGRATRLRDVYHSFEKRAHAWLMDPKTGSTTLRKRVEDAQIAKNNAKRPVTDPKSPQFNPGALLQSLGR